MTDPGKEVLIVGAGPVGLALALELARRDVKCRVLEARNTARPTSRAYAIQRRTVEILTAMGVVERVLAEPAPPSPPPSGKKGPLVVFNVDGQVLLPWFDANTERRSLRTPLMGHALPQTEVERALEEKVTSLGVAIEQGVEISSITQDDQGVVAIAGDRQFRGSWLVGCDGSHSAVRKSMDVAFNGSVHGYDLLLADVMMAWKPESPPPWVNGGFYIYFSKYGAASVWFLRRVGFWRVTVLVRNKDKPLTVTTEELINQVLRERCKLVGVEIVPSDITWLSSWRVSERLAAQYRKGRVLIAGDAAHIHSPIGGQGLNLGVADAYNLGWKLALVVKALASPSLLDTYEAERVAVARRVLRFTKWLTKLFEVTGFMGAVRNYGILQVCRLSAVRSRVQMQLSQLTLNYRRSSLSQSVGAFDRNAPKAGDRAPNAVGQAHPMLTPTSVFGILDTNVSILLFQGQEPGADDLGVLAHAIDSRFGSQVRPHIIASDENSAARLKWKGSIVVDSNHDIHEAYSVSRRSIFVIRPDGYIGLRCSPPAENILVNYLGRVFDPTLLEGQGRLSPKPEQISAN